MNNSKKKTRMMNTRGPIIQLPPSMKFLSVESIVLTGSRETGPVSSAWVARGQSTFLMASEKERRILGCRCLSLIRFHMRKEISAANTAFRSKVNLYLRRALQFEFIQSDSIGIFGLSGGVFGTIIQCQAIDGRFYQ